MPVDARRRAYLFDRISVKMFHPTTIISASPDVIVCDLDNAKALLNLKTGTYFGLNGSAGLVWESLSEPQTYRDVYDTLLAHFDVEEQVLKVDLDRLLADLNERGLVGIG